MAPLIKLAAAGVFAAIVAANEEVPAPQKTKEAPPAPVKTAKEAPPPAKKDTFPIPVPVVEEAAEFIEVAPIAVCPDGSFSSSGCAIVETSDATYSCPHPYKMDKKTGSCSASLFAKPEVTCPKGAVEHKGKCLTSDVVPFETKCPKKTVESKGGCVEAGESSAPDKEVEPKYTCPKGAKVDGDQCVSSTKAAGVYSCEKGYELVKKKCVTRVSVPLTCSKGTLQNDKCVSTESAPKSSVCPKKANYADNGCAVVETTNPSAVCDKGYLLSGKFCVRKLIITTSAAPAPIPQQGSKKGEAPPPPPPAAKKEEPIVDFKCKHKVDEAGNCYMEDKVKPQPVCPAGSDLKGKKCVSIEVLPTEAGCPKGYEEEKGGCVKVEEFKPECPKGYKQDGSLCWKTISEAPLFDCPAGSTEDKKGCTRVTSIPAVAQCPKKANMDKSGRCIIQGSVGTRSRVVEPEKFCPKGYHKMADGCVKDVSSEGEFVCDKGYTLKKKKCVSEHSISPIMMCPKGFVSVKGGRCTRTTYEPPSFVCPEGTIGKGKKCYQAPERRASPKKGEAPAPKKQTPSPLKKLGESAVDPTVEAIEAELEPVETSSVNDLGAEEDVSADAEDLGGEANLEEGDL